MTSWHERHDPENPENRNAGNGGDLVKHTIYLSALDYLLAHSPWERRAERSVAARRDCYRTLIQGETMAATPRLNTVIRALEDLRARLHLQRPAMAVCGPSRSTQ